MSTVPGDKSRKQRRSRIVVNVEDLQPPQKSARTPPQRTPQPRGARRARLRGVHWLVPIGVIVVVMLALCAGTYLWWQSFKAKPAYSLALLLDAARRDDQQTFDALLDTDAVSRSLAPQVAAQMSAPERLPQLSASVRRQLQANAVVLLPGAREQVRATFMQQVKDVLQRSGTADNYFLTLALGVARVVEIKPGLNGAADDTSATASLNVNGRPVELGMLRAPAPPGGTANAARWRIVSVKSDELAARVAETLARVYPAGK